MKEAVVISLRTNIDQGKKADSEAAEHEEEKDEPYKQIGQLKVENDWLKKI